MIDIIIVNWNSGSLLANCIRSLYTEKNLSVINKVIVIDNFSKDGSLLNLPLHEKLDIVRNETNNGFAKACNQGIARSTSPYILLLNPDAELLDNTLATCLAHMQGANEVQVLGCQLIDQFGHVSPTCSRFPSPLRIFFDAVGLSRLAPRLFHPATIMTDWNHQESRYVNQVMGAFMLIRRATFEKIGVFDERFFVYFEEVDFCRRVNAAGGKVFYLSSQKAMHVGEGTTQRVKAFRLCLSLHSRLLYARKHFSFPGFMVVVVSTFLFEPISRFAWVIMKGRIAEVSEIAQGFKLLLQKCISKATN